MSSLLATTLSSVASTAEELSPSPGLTTFLNPYSYLLARDQAALFQRFRIGIDGIGLVLLLRLACGRRVQRISFDMTSLAPVVLADAVRRGSSVCLVGARQPDLERARARLQESFPGLRIVESRNGYFADAAERSSYLDGLAASNPDVVIVGMGTPLQERFLVDLCARGWRGAGYTCGGFLHQTAVAMDYYPAWMDRFHLRWLYRIYDEPRLARRYFIDYPRFLCCFLYDRWRLPGLRPRG